MAERQIGQLSFKDELVSDGARANAPPERVSELLLLLQHWYGLSAMDLA